MGTGMDGWMDGWITLFNHGKNSVNKLKSSYKTQYHMKC